jgi:orotate phosphoribosyltransferase
MTKVLSRENVVDALESTSALRRGHFVLTSGRHSDSYVQCARVFEDPALTTTLASGAVAALPDGLRVDAVAAPAVGGLVFGFAVAQALGVKFIFSERSEGAMVFRRSFEVVQGAHYLVAEDVVTTGGSVAEVIALIESGGGVVAGVVSLIDRGGQKAFSTPYWPLLTLDVASWPAETCELCARGLPVDSPGSRRL